MRTGVTAALIVKNEAAFLAGCLQSVQPWVDRIVVVDTGSTDGTPAIARQFGARVLPHIWQENFAAARNAALDAVRTPWVLFIDADEVVVADDVPILRQAMEHPKAHAYNVRIVSLADRAENLSEALVTRLFRTRIGIRWSGAVHEQVIPSIKERRLQLDSLSARFLHYGYLGSVVSARDKVARNLSLLERETKRTPKDPYAWWQLSQSYIQANRPQDAQQALATARRLNQLSGSPAERHSGLDPLMALTEAKAQWMGGALEDAEITLTQAVGEWPTYTDFWYYRGLVRAQRQQLEDAYQDWMHAADLGTPQGFLQTETGIAQFKAPWRMAMAAAQMQRYPEAVALLLLTIRRQPYFQTAWRQWLELCQGTPIETLGQQLTLVLSPAQIVMTLRAFPQRTLSEDVLLSWALIRAERQVAS